MHAIDSTVFNLRNKSQFGGVNSPSDGILGFLSGMPENPVISVIRPKYRYSSHPAATIQVVMQPGDLGVGERARRRSGDLQWWARLREGGVHRAVSGTAVLSYNQARNYQLSS